MKNNRPNTYLGTFVNSEEGISSYKMMVKTIRQTVNGGRFVKMFRGSPRPYRVYNGMCVSFKHYQGSSRKEGSTHFDVYFLHRVNRGSVSYPKFYNFELK